MSNARDYLLVVDNDKEAANSIAHATAQELQTRQTTLIDVVQSLGEYINDEDEKIRSRAISYLTAIIAALPPTYLSRQQIQVLCQFLCDRIEDGGAIDGLSRLQSLDRFTNDMAQVVVRALFEHFSDLQTRTQSSRHRILQLLNDLMSNYRKGLHAMGEESLVGITELVSGEKDPRNLMLIFSILRAIMIEWDITKHAETLFDSVYAYFPITFRPPPNDPYGITAQDLKDRLRDCISSTPLLAPYAIPNMLDKLDSTSPVVKKDVLQALMACAKTYDPFTMSHYSITLWDALKFEILSAQEPELAEETLLVLREIACCLSESTNASLTSSPLAQYLRPINKECIEHLQEPAQRQAKAAGDMLKAISSANIMTFVIVVKAVIAPMLTVYQSADGIIKQRALLEVLNQLFESAIVVLGTWRIPVSQTSPGIENPLDPFKDKFLGMYSQAMMSTVKEEVSFRVTAAKGLLLLSQMRSFLEDAEIGLIVQHYNEIVLGEESYGRDELRRTSMQGLAQISANKPRPIMDITFPAFMARLPDTGDEADSTNTYRSTLEGLSEISVEKDVSETLVRRLLNKIDVLLQDGRGSVPYASAILSTVLYVLTRSAKAENLEIYFDRIVVGFSRRVVTDLKSSQTSVMCDAQVLELLARTQNLIVHHSSQQKQVETCMNVFTLFTGGVDLSALTQPVETSGRVTINSDRPSHVAGSLSNALILSTSLLAAIPREQISDVDQISGIIDNLVQFLVHRSSHSNSTTGTMDPVQIACLRQIALLINKHLPTSSLEIANVLLKRCYQSLLNAGNAVTIWVRLIFTIAKAMILRVAPSSRSILADLMSLLRSESFAYDEKSTEKSNGQGPAGDATWQPSRIAASGFSTILARDEVVSKINHAQIRLLAPQRVFQTLVPLIASRFRESSSSVEKENCLVALSGIISNVPSELVLPELSTLLPLLLQSLDLSDNYAVKVATLETLAVIIATSPAALEESGHVAALVRRLIHTASPGGVVTNIPRIRQLGVRCLFLMPGHIVGGASRPNPLLPLKSDVLQGLRRVLDDPKRDVRREAVDARAAWIRGVDDVKDDDSD